MATIDEVIERSREAGGFSERKRFTVARGRAIQKMRQFALADTSYYILEWIQAAIANGASYLDIAIGWDEVRMSYVGGGFAREELEALFDFLFASKDDLDVADARQLALGMNALLAVDPRTIVIESGDGTLEGTTRVEIDGRSDTVSVGTPTQPLEGTFVRATGISRSSNRLKELAVIEERCLTAPIPILVNDAPLFGYSSIRSPDLFGYKRVLKFDEGDLYGTIGLATTPITQNFKLITFGAWITSTRRPFQELPAMGGVIGYDRLRKTADHSGIVQDEVYEEMWARLAPYARQLASGESGRATFDIRTLDGDLVSVQEFRKIARERERVILFPLLALQGDEGQQLGRRYELALDAPVFLVNAQDRDTVRHLGGPDVEVFTPNLDVDELQFYEKPIATDPPRPWLTGVIEVPQIDAVAVADRMVRSDGPEQSVTSLARKVQGSSGITARVFTPAELPEDAELWVDIRVSDRDVWRGSISSAYPGHYLVVEFEELPLSSFELSSGPASVGSVLADAVAREVERLLLKATERVLSSVRPDGELQPAAQRIILAALARSTMKRLRRDDDGTAGVRFALTDSKLPDVLRNVGILRTVSGDTLSLRDLEALLPHTCGLVYGTRGTVELPDEVDQTRIFLVDEPTERLLVNLLGEASYVRFNRTLRLAEHGGVHCGATLPGLRRYPDDFPFAVEGVRTVDLEESVRQIRHQLMEVWSSEHTSAEVFRHVQRHLVWFLVHATDEQRRQLADEPLFRAPDGGAFSFSQIRAPLTGEKGLPMYDGWSADLTWGSAPDDAAGGEPALAMNPFAFYALSRIGRVRPILDIDLTGSEARANPTTPEVAFLESETLGDGLAGEIGFPMTPVAEPLVLVVDRGSLTAVALRSVGAEFGIVGRVRNLSAMAVEDVERRCAAAAAKLLDELIQGLSASAPESAKYHRALEILLGFAERRVKITAGPDRSLAVTCLDPDARRILDLPVIPTTVGVSVTPWRLLREYVNYGDREPRPGRAELAPTAPALLVDWLNTVLDPSRIDRSSDEPIDLPPQTSLDRWLTEVLGALRTDDDLEQIEVRFLDDSAFRDLAQRLMTPTERNILLFRAAAETGQPTRDGVFIHEQSWLAHGLVDPEGNPDPERTAWLLLAMYARINELRLRITNIHEMHFHSRVLDWLQE